MIKPKKKTFIYIILILAIALVVFPSFVYRILPAKQVTLETEFILHKGQTVKFGNDKYLTMCGFKSIELSRVGSIVSWKIDGQHFPCEWTTHQFVNAGFMGPHNPYTLEEVSGHSSGQLVVKIHESNTYFDTWSLNHLESECGTTYNNTHPKEKVACYKYSPSDVGNPRVCKMQKFISEKDCLDGFVENFTKEQCSLREEEHNVKYGTWNPGVDNQDDCLKQQINYRHLPSESCLLLMQDEIKRKSCFEERKKEEDYFNSLRSK